MPRTTRQELYELAWSEPMRSLAKKFSVTDRGLAKICAEAKIPVPTRGYWAKLQAGKKAVRSPLPPRGLGQDDTVWIGRHARDNAGVTDADILKAPIPSAPRFATEMDDVRSQAAELVRKAPLPLRDTHGWHSQVAKCLKADEERAKKQAAASFRFSSDDPVFTSAFEQRRLRIVNALFVCLTRCGMRPRLSGTHARDLSVDVGDTVVPLRIDSVASAKLLERERQGYQFTPRGDRDAMYLMLRRDWAEADGPTWRDAPGAPLEKQLRDIAAAIIVFGEQTFRDSAVRAHARRIEYRAELEEARRREQIEAERQRLIRQAKREQGRVDQLLKQAQAHEQARQIRAYVEAVRAANGSAQRPMSDEDLASWTSWALEQADRVDPVLSGLVDRSR